MKKCELCKKVARMYCDSDRASLCWDCDSRVHTANFLVAKHTRTLLCHACQSPTPWTGSGPKLGPTVSVCDACVNRSDRGMDGDRGSGSGNTEEDDDDDEEEEDGEDQHDDDEENGDRVREDDDDSENQVVPLSLPPSSASSSSGSEESSGRRDGFSSTSFGFSNTSTTVENGRFSLNDVERPAQRNGTQKMRSWTWR